MAGSNLTNLELEHLAQLLPGKALLQGVTSAPPNLGIFLQPKAS